MDHKQAGNTEEKEETIGIIGAMPSEVRMLKESMDIEDIILLGGMEFYRGRLFEKAAVVVQCGIGKVHAAICAHALIDHFGAGKIINTGVAGSLDKKINIGDIVISTDAVQHDFDITQLGFKKGEIPYTGKAAFPASKEMRALAKRAASKVVKEDEIFEGRVCSGDRFIASHKIKEEIVANFDGMCTEMEGAAIAQTCYLYDIPYVIIRAISDKADDSEEVSFEEFQAMAAERCAAIVTYILMDEDAY